MVFQEGFLGHKLSVLTQSRLVLSRLSPKCFASQKYCSYLSITIEEKSLMKLKLGGEPSPFSQGRLF